jgi:hypothetical protein
LDVDLFGVEVLVEGSAHNTVVVDTHAELLQDEVEVAIRPMLPALAEHHEHAASALQVLFQCVAL